MIILRKTNIHIILIMTKLIRVLIISFSIFACAILNGCNSNITSATVVGVYQTKVNYGVGVLTLSPSGKYLQAFTYSNGKKVTNSGKWSFFAPNSVSLANAVTINASGLGRSNWSLQVDSLSSKKWIEYDPDQGGIYHKIK